jgi:trigger factor
VTSPAKSELDVQVEVKELEGGRVELAVEVPPEPVTAARERAIKDFGRQVNIPGFRKGKAPRAVVERHIDPAALKNEVVEALLSDAYDAALEKAGVKPLDRARIGEADLTQEGSLTFTATITLRPPIELGEYKGLQATRRITRVTPAHIDSELERLRTRRSQFEDLPADAEVAPGDLAVVDYEMFVDGEKQDDASTSGYPLEVGGDQLFPELNDALPGAHPGDTRELEVTYPDSHSDPALAGKTAQFKVLVKQVRRRQLPELDDEFAKQVSDLETMEALRERIQENLEAIGKAVADQDAREDLVRQVSDASSLDVPEVVVSREVDRRIDGATEELERRGLTLHQHLQNLGRSFEDWRADLEAEARQIARRALVLDEIGEREEIKVSEEDIHAEIHRRAESEGISEETLHEQLSDSAELNRLVTRIYQRKVVEFLAENAEIQEEIVEPEAAEEASEEADPAGDTGEAQAAAGETEQDSES